MKPLRATPFLIAFAALIALAAGTRNMIDRGGLIQSTVSASTKLTSIAVDPVLTPQGDLEYDTNRPGSDYRGFELSQADPGICRNECANDSTCKAFTYVKPGVQGANARCWLKSDVPQASPNSCCVSGIKSGGSSSGGLEVNVNRRGGDYRDYDLPSNNPNQCRDDCMNDSQCQSFTFLRPSYRGPNAHCFLKNSVPNATQETCCISGVKAGGGGGGGGGSLVGTWALACCNEELAWKMYIKQQQGTAFSGVLSNDAGGGDVKNGQLRGNVIEFDRVGTWGKQHWSGKLVNDRGSLRMIYGNWTGDYEDRYMGRHDWHAEKQ